MRKKTVRDIDLESKTVLVRTDFNVPFNPNTLSISNTNRIEASIPTIKYLIEKRCKIVICSHLGRPDGKVFSNLSLAPIAEALKALLHTNVCFLPYIQLTDVLGNLGFLKHGEVALLENLRFHKGEESNDTGFCENLASLADVYVNDAFGASHRSHASINGITNYLPSVAGLLLEKEIDSLADIMLNPQKPFTAVLGGAKISDKVEIVERFSEMAQAILIGGGMAATFLKSRGVQIGESLVEDSFIDIAQRLENMCDENGCHIYLPKDVVVSTQYGENVNYRECLVDDIRPEEMIMDIGPETQKLYRSILMKSATVLWNGPMGMFEWKQYQFGTRTIARTLADGPQVSVIGGGSTVDAVSQFGLESEMDHVSTGGGATLEYLRDGTLPGVEALWDK